MKRRTSGYLVNDATIAAIRRTGETGVDALKRAQVSGLCRQEQFVQAHVSAPGADTLGYKLRPFLWDIPVSSCIARDVIDHA
jgi:hypothetical protein